MVLKEVHAKTKLRDLQEQFVCTVEGAAHRNILEAPGMSRSSRYCSKRMSEGNEVLGADVSGALAASAGYAMGTWPRTRP